MVLIDTPIWSLAFRRRAVDLAAHELRLTQRLYELVRQGRAQLLGSTRQEVLSGIREEPQFRKVRSYLRAFEDVALIADDYEEAARMSNLCRASGIAPSSADMLICAASGRRRWEIFSTDHDFVRYSEVLSLSLMPISQ